MKSDLLESKIYKTKRNLMVYLNVFAIASFIFKLSNGVVIDLKSNLMEFFITAVSIVLFTIQFARVFGVPEKDEKMIKEKYMINDIGFKIILWGGIGVHFISNLIYDHALILEKNAYLSLIILIGFIVFVMSARKAGFYLNYKHIEKPKKDYYKSILFSLGKICLIAIGYMTVIYSLSLSLVIGFDKVLVIFSSIALSLIFFSIEYFMFSIFEKIDYDEKALYAEKHVLPFLSKKVILLGLPIIGFTIIFQTVNFLVFKFESSGSVLAYHQFRSLMILLQYWQIDFLILGVILSFVIYKSIKKLPVEKPHFFKYFPLMIWISFGLNVISYLYVVFLPVIALATQLETIAFISNLNQYVTFAILLVVLALVIYMYPFLKKHHFPAHKVVLLIPMIPILARFVYYFHGSLSISIANIMVQRSLIELIFAIVSNFLLYYVYCSMSFSQFKVIQSQNKRESKNIALNKKLIH